MDRPDMTQNEAGRIEAKHVELAYPLNRLSPHAAASLAAGEKARFFLVDMRGLTAEAARALLPVIDADMKGRRLVPVIVTDLTDYRAFREAEVIFEAVPPLADSARIAPDLDWVRRQAEVMALIRDKWRPVGETALGPGEP